MNPVMVLFSLSTGAVLLFLLGLALWNPLVLFVSLVLFLLMFLFLMHLMKPDEHA